MEAEESREDPREEAALRRLLIEQLPRYPAPPRLREAILAAVAPPPRKFSWWAPALSALATALVLTLLGLPLLPRAVEPDPLRPVVSAVLSAHTRSLIWGEPRPEAAPAALPRVMAETGITLPRFFAGDAETRLINVEPLIVEGRRALALTYQDADAHVLTYLLLPGADMPLPDQGRVTIDRFRPVLTRVDGFSLFVWKQQGLANFLISDMISERDVSRFKELFLKVRLAAEP